MTDVRLQEFAQLLSKVDEGERNSLWARAKLLAMNMAEPDAFEAPIQTLGDYLAREIPVPPILVEPALVVRGGITCMVGRAGKGKDAPLDVGVVTPTGVRRMGDLAVGDMVMDPATGTPVSITGIFPQGRKQVYKVTMNDGTATETSATHLWSLRKWSHGTKLTNYELQDVMHDLKNDRGDAKWYLPPVAVMNYGRPDPDIDPYILGVLLGDGGISNANVNFTVSDSEIVDEVQRRLPEGCTLRKCGQHPLRWRILGESQGHRNPIIDCLRELGLWGCRGLEKFVPEAALTATAEYRRELLRGLIDTDGGIRKDSGSVSFYSCSKSLADGVASLTRSLGGRASMHFRLRKSPFVDAMTAEHSVSILTDFNPARLSRKANNWKRPTRLARCIVDVQPSRVTETQCIMLDSESHLYMQDDFIPVHNTQVNINRLLKWSCGRAMFPGIKTPDDRHVLSPSGPLKVLIIENEGSPGMFHQQITTMVNAPGYLGPTEKETAKENVFIWGDGGYSGLKLDDQAKLNLVRAGCEKWEPDILFIEPFRGLWQGDENSSTDMAQVADALSAVATEYDCGVILTHHERKSGPGEDGEKMSAGRGSTVLEGVVATMENFEVAKGGDYRELSWSKVRYGGGVKVLPVRMEWQPGDYWYKHVPLEVKEQSILSALAESDDPMTIREISEETSEKGTDVNKVLKDLVASGKVRKLPAIHTGSGSTGNRYSLHMSTGDDDGMDF